MLGRLIRPALTMSSKANSVLEFSITPIRPLSRAPTIATKLHDIQLGSTRVMATSSSNYHYHEKPPEHKHDALWRAERYLSLALLGVLPAAWFIPHPFMDYAVATSLVVHVHWGVEAIVTDYVRPSIFGPIIPKISVALVYVLSILAAGGLFLFNWTDVGITQALKMLSRI